MERICEPLEDTGEDNLIDDAIEDKRHAEGAPIVGPVSDRGLGNPNQQLVGGEVEIMVCNGEQDVAE